MATSDSSMLAQDCTDYTGSVSTYTCIFEVVNGFVSLMGGLPNCSATLCAVTGVPCGVSHDRDGIDFWKSRCANCWDCYTPVDVTQAHPVLWIQFLSGPRHSVIFMPFAKSCLARGVRFSMTTPWSGGRVTSAHLRLLPQLITTVRRQSWGSLGLPIAHTRLPGLRLSQYWLSVSISLAKH